MKKAHIGSLPNIFYIMLYTVILNNNKDFLNLYKRGRFIASKYSVVYFKPNGRPYNRFGITAGKKIGGAVVRNRAKRIIRYAYRENEHLLPIGIDIVIVARFGIVGVKSTEFSQYFEKYAIPEIERKVKSLIK